MAESYAKATAFVTGTLLSVSVFYDYNFLRALSLSFGDVPTTISDHVRTAILWLPPAMLAGFFMGIVSLTLRVYFGEWFIPGLGQLTQEQLAVLTDQKGTTPASGLPTRRMSNKRLFLTALLLPILFSLLLTLIPILEDIIGRGRLYLNFMVLWFYGSFFLIRNLPTNLGHYRLNQLGLAIFVIVPIMLAYVGKTGYEDGLSMKEGHWGSGRYITMKYANGDIESCEALGLRRFSTTAIVVGKDQQVGILSADSILEVRVDYRATKDARSSCPSMNCDSTGCSR